MAFGKLRLVLFEAFDQSAEVFRGATDQRAAQKQRSGQRGRGPMDLSLVFMVVSF